MNVYDFDNTIYRGESGADLFFFYLRRDPKLLRKVPWGLKLLAQYKSGRMTLQQVLETYSDEVVGYWQTIGDFDGDVVRFWDKNEHKIKPFYLSRRRDDDVILSACPDIVLEEICRRLNIRQYIGTETDRETRRLVRFCYRENKASAFRERYPDAVVENFYTDSFNDSAMIELAENAYLVKGERCRKIK